MPGRGQSDGHPLPAHAMDVRSAGILGSWNEFSCPQRYFDPSDYEFTKGRKTYAKIIGGAYYAAKLPVLKHLNEWGRQAAAIIFLEVHPEWLPLGVWRVREICRRALSTTPVKCESLNEAIEEASKHLTTPMKHWTRQSKILRHNRTQRTLLQFI